MGLFGKGKSDSEIVSEVASFSRRASKEKAEKVTVRRSGGTVGVHIRTRSGSTTAVYHEDDGHLSMSHQKRGW